MRLAALILCLIGLSACREDRTDVPGPMPLTAETVAHYCMMNIADHPGPKAQIFLEGIPDPIFFAQVRDAFTYLASAEQDGYVAVVYVSDMKNVPWHSPGADNWIKADTAQYVVGSDRRGGMGAPELVPFSDRASAERFAGIHGGRVLGMENIPGEAYLAPVDLVLQQEEEQG